MILVEFEFRKIQAFLFESPRLRDMVGANVLLGEVIRCHLPRMAEAHEARGIAPEGLDLPGPDLDDPVVPVEEQDRDDPAALYARGVLARDGGHFRAAFADRSAAEAFLEDAEALLAEEVLGLRYDIHLDALGEDGKTSALRVEGDGDAEVALVDAPLFAACSAKGTGPAEAPDPDRDNEPVSAGILKRRQAYRRFRKTGRARDIISLVERGLPRSDEAADDLHKLCGNDYVAVIHADGNDVGARAKAAGDGVEVRDRNSYFQGEARFERFFNETRVSFRKAVVEALLGVFHDGPGGEELARLWAKGRPYQPLMLGGDDLLLACRAKQAIPFVLALAHALRRTNPGLTFGAGIAVASPDMPFHHLNDIAESLSASAKRLYRHLAATGHPASVVDWHVETASRTPDLGAFRRQQALVASGEGGEREIFATLQRPLPILSDGTGDGPGQRSPLATLEGLAAATGALGGTARSQLRRLAGELQRGRRWSERAFESLPPDLLTVLRDPSRVGMQSLWRQAGEGRWVTPFRDLVEVAEIQRLATAPDGEATP